MDDNLSNKQLIIYAMVCLLVGFIFGSVSLTYPFGRDQGIYAYIGKLLLEGKIQYKYAFDLKPPGVHYIFALGESIFGKSMFAMRLFDIVWQSLTALVIFLITYKYTKSSLSGFVSSVLYIFLYYRYDYWHTLQADGFLNLSFALCILILMSIDFNDSLLKTFLAGVLLSFTIIFKYTLLIFLPFVILWFILYSPGKKMKNLKYTTIFLMGFILFLAGLFSLFLITGAIKQFIDIQFIQIPLYANIGYETESLKFIIANTIRLFFGSVYSPLILFSAALLIYALKRKAFTKDIFILASWLVCSIINLIVQWKFFYYHFLVIIPPLVCGASISFYFMYERFLKKKNVLIANVVTALVLIIYLGLASKPYYHNYSNLFDYFTNKKTLDQLYIENGTTLDSAFMIQNTFKAVDYVKANTKDSDYIYVWGFDPLVYYLSGRKSASRFIYNYPLFWKGNNTEYREEFLNELRTHRPKLILVSSKDPLYYISGYHEDSRQILLRLPDIKNYFDCNYTYSIKVENFYVYESRTKNIE